MAANSLEIKLRRYVLSLKKHDELSTFIQFLNRSGEAYIFGGAPRDVAFVGRRIVNDLDIIVSGDLDSKAVEQFSEVARRTNFGGLRVSIGRFDVDIWELRKSYAFRFDSSDFISVRNLLGTVCFSTDGIAVSLKSGRTIKSSAFEKALQLKLLDFIVPPPELKAVVAARIARLMLKLDLELTPAVASYFIQSYEEFGAPALIEAEARWGERRILNEVSVELIKVEIWNAVKRAYQQLRGDDPIVHFNKSLSR